DRFPRATSAGRDAGPHGSHLHIAPAPSASPGRDAGFRGADGAGSADRIGAPSLPLPSHRGSAGGGFRSAAPAPLAPLAPRGRRRHRPAGQSGGSGGGWEWGRKTEA
ncbi:hypothetical protein EG874_16970, partial [Enterococcus faecalis]